MTNILLYAYDYLDELRSNDSYMRLIKLNKELNEDTSKLFVNFRKLKIKYEEVLEYGNHHPDFKEVSQEFLKVKKEVYQSKIVIEYLELNKSIENKVKKLCNDMALAISKNIPIENELGLFNIGGTCSGCK